MKLGWLYRSITPSQTIAIHPMLELILERWNNADGSVDHLWSIWRDGRRDHMGGPHTTMAAAEAEAIAFCRDQLDGAPDRITRL